MILCTLQWTLITSKAIHLLYHEHNPSEVMRMALSTWWWLDLPSTLDSWAVAPHPDASITAWCRHFMCWMLIAASGNTFESWDIRGGWLGCLAYPSWLAPLYLCSLPWHLYVVASPSRCLSATTMVESPSEQSCGDCCHKFIRNVFWL